MHTSLTPQSACPPARHFDLCAHAPALQAQVWPGPCHFPDFFSEKGAEFFRRQLAAHFALVPWDGIWIDMDEVSK